MELKTDTENWVFNAGASAAVPVRMYWLSNKPTIKFSFTEKFLGNDRYATHNYTYMIYMCVMWR